MKPIKKSNPPKAFINFVDTWKPFSKTHSPFNDLKNDSDLNPLIQNSLVEEQGYICCYCMQELPVWKDKHGNDRPKIKIEHYKPKSYYDGNVHNSKDLCKESGDKREDLRVDYNNLLAACCDNPHCDDDGSGKGSKELCYILNPALVADKNFKRLYQIKYNNDGKISSNDLDINRELGGEFSSETTSGFNQGILNLNHEPLRKARRKAWRIVSKNITKDLGTPDWNSNREEALIFAKKYRDRYKRKRKADGKFFEYCGIVVFMLENRFRELRT